MSAFNLAICQFPVSAEIRRNARRMERMIRSAVEQGADVVHLPEGALSGYAGVQFQTWVGFDWATLRRETEKLLSLGRECHTWLLFGSAHPLTTPHLPHNSVYVVSPAGEIVERYDKLFCTRQDLSFYTPGDHLCLFELQGVRCGVLICHDSRYPELYRRYYGHGVRCIFQSFYNASAQGPTIHTAIIRPTLQAHAACNHLWISVSNASNHYQTWPSVLIVPDGRIVGSLRRHRAGMMVHAVDTAAEFVDKCDFREVAVSGGWHSGTSVDDPRSRQRDSL
jgi:deaminated glutathione amidase